VGGSLRAGDAVQLTLVLLEQVKLVVHAENRLKHQS
jgi:hypothetical protein